jgi:hypothetical protein
MMAAVLALASVPVRAAEPASVFKTSLTAKTWTIGVAKDSVGKIKIYDEKPVYNDDEEIAALPKMKRELRNPGDTFELSRSKTYYIIFYPKWGRTDFTALFYQGKDDTAAARFNVKKLVVPGLGSMKFEVKLSDNKFAFTLPNVDNFEAFDGDPAHADPAPVFTLN